MISEIVHESRVGKNHDFSNKSDFLKIKSDFFEYID